MQVAKNGSRKRNREIVSVSVLSSQNVSWESMIGSGFDSTVEFFPRGNTYARRKLVFNSIFDIFGSRLVRYCESALGIYRFLPDFRS